MPIIICDRCKGVGRVVLDVGTHKIEYEYEECHKCRGSGRLSTSTRTTESAFVPGNATPTPI